MSDQQTAAQPTLADSKSGQNRYILACEATQQSMLYCSCLARLGALDSPGVKTPKDWQECGRHRVHGQCAASKMRSEELEKGQALYFVPPGSQLVQGPGHAWITSMAPKKSLPAPLGKTSVKPMTRSAPAPAPAPKASSMLDVIEQGNNMAAVVNAAAKTLTPLPVSEPHKPTVPLTVIATKPQAAPPQMLKPTTDGIHPRPVSTGRPPMLPGESPLAYARRLKASTT